MSPKESVRPPKRKMQKIKAGTRMLFSFPTPTVPRRMTIAQSNAPPIDGSGEIAGKSASSPASIAADGTRKRIEMAILAAPAPLPKNFTRVG